MRPIRGDCASWRVPDLPGVECFRARALTRSYPRHTHDAFAIGVIERGTGVSRYRGATRYFPEGHIVAMSPAEPHTGCAADARGLTYRMFYIAEDVIRSTLSVRAVPSLPNPCIPDSRLARRLASAHRAMESRDRLAGQTMLVETLFAMFQRHGSAPSGVTFACEPVAVARAKEFLREHHARPVSTSELASVVGLSVAYLIRAFRRAAGVPPHQWVLQLRVELAKDLIAAGRPLATIASELGFSDQSHLTRRFHALTGLTPGQYAASQNRSIQ